MSGPMVKAILEGRKTQTRRVIKIKGVDIHDRKWIQAKYYDRGDCWFINDGISSTWSAKCPYGQVGSKLWVREAWRVGAWDEEDGRIAVDYRADGYCRLDWLDVTGGDGDEFNDLWIQSCEDAVRAGLDVNAEGRYSWDKGQSPCRWRPSIFMPRWASRILLEITEVRVQRVQEISEEDAKAEGIKEYSNHTFGLDAPAACMGPIPVMAYMRLWDSINAKRGYPWSSNPWCWCLTFKRVS